MQIVVILLLSLLGLGLIDLVGTQLLWLVVTTKDQLPLPYIEMLMNPITQIILFVILVLVIAKIKKFRWK